MSRRRAARIDDNHAEIVAHLEAIGCSVQSLAAVGKGVPDLLVGRRAVNVLIEIKDGAKSPSRRKLTDDQTQWHRQWRGQVAVVESPADAEKAVLAAEKWSL